MLQRISEGIEGEKLEDNAGQGVGLGGGERQK
jgi:hypothetical protein